MAYFKRVKEPLAINGANVTVTILECAHEVTELQYSEDYDFIVVGCVDGALRGMNAKHELAFTMQDLTVQSVPCTGMRHRPVTQNFPVSNTFMCTYANGLLKCWNYNFNECTFTTEEKRFTVGIAYHPRKNTFVTFGDDKKINMYDEDSKRKEMVFAASDERNATNGHTNTVTTACFHPRQVNELISGSLDHTVQFWDTRQAGSTRRVESVTLVGPGLAFTPKGDQFFACTPNPSSGTTLRVWDYATAKELPPLKPDKFSNTPCFAGAFISRTQFACGGGSPCFLRIYDINSMQNVVLISNFTNIVKCICGGNPKNRELAFAAGKRIYLIRQ